MSNILVLLFIVSVLMFFESIIIAIFHKVTKSDNVFPNKARASISIISLSFFLLLIFANGNYKQAKEEQDMKPIYDEGYSVGYDAGYYDGFSEAKEMAYQEGYDKAISELNDIISNTNEDNHQQEIVASDSEEKTDYEKLGENANEELKKKLLNVNWSEIQDNSYDKGKKLGEWLRGATE